MDSLKKKYMSWRDKPTKELLKESLKKEAPSITSTDTLYGFLGNTSKKCYETIQKIKDRNDSKPFLILIGSYESLNYFVDPTNLTKQLMSLLTDCWPGPLTIVFRAHKDLSPHLVSHNSTVALRFTNHKDLQELASLYNGLLSTSANKAGALPPSRLVDIDDTCIQKCMYVVGELPFEQEINRNSYTTMPSSIIDVSKLYCNACNKEEQHECRTSGPIQIIRTGAYPLDKVEHLYGQKCES